MIHSEYLSRIRRRLAFARFPLWAFVILLTVRFWQLQIVRGEEFSDLARDNYLQTERRRAPRGLVVDRRGEVLARSEPSFTLLADEAGLGQLEEMGLLSVEEEDRADLEARAARGPAVVRSGIPFAEAAFFEARRRDLTGVRVEFVPARDYPLGSATAHLLGYVGEVTAAQLLLEEFVTAASGDLVGQDGLERVYNATLLGSDGYLDRVVDSRQRVLVSGGLRRTEPVRGETLQVSVIGALQEAAHRAFGDQRGAFVALDVRTGEVLGLGSYPAENTEDFRGDAGKFREMLSDPATPLLNRAVQGRYPPGSSFKLVTAAAGLAEGVIGPDTRYTCNGRARVAGRTFRCHRAEGHGSLSLREAISKSCNVFFYRLSEALDVDVIASYARAFGLGEPTGVDLRNESAGLVPTREWKRRVMGERWYASETASVSVGQGAVSVTPIQMARLTAAVASWGTIPTPRFTGPQSGEQMGGVLPEHFAVIRDGMRDAVVSGTAWRARIPTAEVAAKTGTAQVASADVVAPNNEDRPYELRTHAWFVGFAPFDAPEIALAVVVEHGGAGGAAAAPIGGEILRTYFEESPEMRIVGGGGEDQ
ncbi:MAG: penicillin-binding protein 2 [Acidobacteria bacterium]|nr:penicillin-binding protein 2 [Acidobacteriota bacterium]